MSQDGESVAVDAGSGGICVSSGNWLEVFYRFISNPRVKQIGIITWIGFVIVMLFVIVNPQPFVRLGYWGIFVFNLFGPGTAMIPIVVRHFNPVILAIVSALGMSINDSVSWLVGKHGEVLIPRSVRFLHLENLVRKSNPLVLFLLAVLPIPYDVVGVTGGYMGVPFWGICLPGFLGKIIRFLIIGWGTLYVHHWMSVVYH